MLSSPWRSRINETMVKKATEAYVKSATVPLMSTAHISKNGGGFTQVHSVWSQNLITSGKKRSFSKLFGFSNDTFAPVFESTPLPFESGEAIVAFSSNNHFIIYKTKNAKGEDICILESWSAGGLVKSFNLNDLELHGPVYFDDEFGGLVVNESCTKLAYIAEEKRPKSKSFFKANGSNKVAEVDLDVVGTEYSFIEEWGEQLVDKSQPVIVTLDLTNDDFNVWTGQDVLPSDISPGQLTWIGDEVLAGISTRNFRRRLGIIYCTNRPSAVFSLHLNPNNTNRSRYEPSSPSTKELQGRTLSKGTMRYSLNVLNVADEPPPDHRYKEFCSGKNLHCKSPRVSPNGDQLVWLERDLPARTFPGPHGGCFRLVALDLKSSDAQPRTVVPIFSQVEVGVDDFCGIYSPLPKRCFVSNTEMLFSCPVIDTAYPYVIDIITGDDKIIKNVPNFDVIDVHDGLIVGIKSTTLSPPAIVLAKYEEKEMKTIFGGNLTTRNPEIDMVTKSFTHTANEGHPNPAFKSVKFNSIYTGPAPDIADGSVPLIVWPHGGPHALTPNTFYREVDFFNQLGYGVLFINFRGSLGAGQESVESLLGQVGDTDVKDCFQAMNECLKAIPSLNPEKVVLFGGSHGGFLVTHMAGQYPSAFKAVVARNPVINIASMATVTDIPDWTFNEAGSKFDYLSPSPEILKSMFEKSPIFHADKIEAPMFLMIGKNDLRVPPDQGRELYHHLKSQGKEVYMNIYEDCHPLAKIPVHSDVLVNAALFFESVLTFGCQ